MPPVSGPSSCSPPPTTVSSGDASAVPTPNGGPGADQVSITLADGLRGKLGLYEVNINGKFQYMTKEQIESTNFQHCTSPTYQLPRELVGRPSAEASAEVMKDFREVNGDVVGRPPSKEGQAEAMKMFREVNGDVVGRPPSKEGQAEAMKMFREVNGDPTHR